MTGFRRLRAPAAAAALAGLAMLATGCAIKAGNMKEYRERKRQLEAARAQGAAAAAGGAGTTAETTPAAPVQLLGNAFLVTRRTAEGGLEQVQLHEPLVGHHDRVFLADGSVRDHSTASASFVFRSPAGLQTIKIRELDRVEFLSSGGADRGEVILRFVFRKPRRNPVELPAAGLRGAEHPSPPYIEGIGPRGSVRIPLFAPPGEAGFAPVVEIDFTVEAPEPGPGA